jgi:hypothetical protein
VASELGVRVDQSDGGYSCLPNWLLAKLFVNHVVYLAAKLFAM